MNSIANLIRFDAKEERRSLTTNETRREDDHELNRSDFNHSKKTTKKKINNNSLNEFNRSKQRRQRTRTILIRRCCDPYDMIHSYVVRRGVVVCHTADVVVMQSVRCKASVSLSDNF
jgi:hypothetical protein